MGNIKSRKKKTRDVGESVAEESANITFITPDDDDSNQPENEVSTAAMSLSSKIRNCRDELITMIEIDFGLLDEMESTHDPRVQAIIDSQMPHVEFRLIGEFEAPEWEVIPPGFT